MFSNVSYLVFRLYLWLDLYFTYTWINFDCLSRPINVFILFTVLSSTARDIFTSHYFPTAFTRPWHNTYPGRFSTRPVGIEIPAIPHLTISRDCIFITLFLGYSVSSCSTLFPVYILTSFLLCHGLSLILFIFFHSIIYYFCFSSFHFIRFLILQSSFHCDASTVLHLYS